MGGQEMGHCSREKAQQQRKPGERGNGDSQEMEGLCCFDSGTEASPSESVTGSEKCFTH